MRALVYGTARNLGAQVAATLSDHGHEVVEANTVQVAEVLDALGRDVGERHLAGSVIIDPEAPDLGVAPADFDVVVICAIDGYSAGARTPVAEEERCAEVAAVSRLLAEGPRRVVLGSSAVVYAVGGGELDEKAPTDGTDPLAGHCLELERLVNEWASAHDAAAFVLRPAITVGSIASITQRRRASKIRYLFPGIEVTKTRYPLVEARITSGGELLSDHNIGDFVHVTDVCAAFEQAAEAAPTASPGARVINLGTGRALRGTAYADAFPEVDDLVVEVAPSAAEARLPVAVLRSDEAARQLGWAAKASLGDAVLSELGLFHREALAKVNAGSSVRLFHEFLSSSVSGGTFTLTGVIGAIDRRRRFDTDDVYIEIGEKLYRPEFASGLRSPAKGLTVRRYRLSVPLADLQELPIQNAVRLVFVGADGSWFRRRLRYSSTRFRSRYKHGRLHILEESDSTLYVRQAARNLLYITLRARNQTDDPALWPRIRLARAIAFFDRRPITLLYEKESGRYEESGSVVFEKLVDSGRTNVRYVLAPERMGDVPQRYRPYVVERFSLRHFVDFFRTRSFVGTEAVAHSVELRTAHPALLRKILGTKYGYVFLQHGVMYMVALSSSQRSPFRAGGALFPEGSKVVCSSEAEAQHFISLGGFKREDLYVSGLAKFDRASREPDADLILIMPTWRPWEYNTIRANPLEAPYVAMLREIYESVPAELRSRARIMPHPLVRDTLLESELADHMWTGDSYDQALSRCAMLITDYSSIAYDAFYRGANVVFWWKEKEYCMEQYGGHLMIDDETAPGPVCYSAEELRDVVSRIHDAPQGDEYVRRYREIVEFHDGKNTERLLAMMERDGLI